MSQAARRSMLSVCRARQKPSKLQICCCPKMKPGCYAATCRARPLLVHEAPLANHSSMILSCSSHPLGCTLPWKQPLAGLLLQSWRPSMSSSLCHRAKAAVNTAWHHLQRTHKQPFILIAWGRQQQMILRLVLDLPRTVAWSHSMTQMTVGRSQLQCRTA